MKNRKIRISIFLLLLLAIFCFFLVQINENKKFKKDLVVEDSKYNLKVLYTIADKNVVKKDDTIYEILRNYNGKGVIYRTYEAIPLTKKGNYLYADISNFLNESYVKGIKNYTFALNDFYGNTLKDCTYDKKTHVVKIPFSYYKDKKEKEIPVQVQFDTRMEKKDIKRVKINIKSKNIFTSSKTVYYDGRSDETSFTIKKVFGKDVKKDDFKIYLNGSKKEVAKENYSIKDGKVSIKITPILVNKINIELNNKFSFFTKVSALNGPISVSSMNAIPLDERHVSPKLNLLHSGMSLGSYVPAGYFRYCFDDMDLDWCTTINGTKQITTGWVGDNKAAYDRTYYWYSSEYQSGYYSTLTSGGSLDNTMHFYPFAFQLNALNELGMANDYGIAFSPAFIPMPCQEVGNTVGMDVNMHVSVYLEELGDDYMLLRLTTDQITTQYGDAYIKVSYEGKKTGYVQVDKTHSPAENTARSFELYNVGASGDCTTIGSKVSDSVRSTSASTPNRYYLGWNSSQGAFLELGKTYCVHENGDGTPGTDVEDNYHTSYSNEKMSGGKYYGQVTLSESSSTDSEGMYYTTATVTNTHKVYCTQVTKRDSDDTNRKISGITFELYNSSKASMGISKTTDGNGVAKFEGLQSGGTYYVKETSANGTSGMWNSHEGEFIAVSATEGSCSNTNVDDHRQYYCFRVRKKDANEAKAGRNTYLGGFTFTGTGSYADNAATKTSGSDGYAYFFTGTDNSQRTVTESGAASGYQKSSESKTVTPTLMTKNASKTDASACTATAIEFSNYKYVINWFKEVERNTSGSTNKRTAARFKVRNSSNQYVVVNGTETLIDSAGVSKTCYKYSSVNGSGTEITTGAIGGKGEACITGLPSGTYTVVETHPASNHAFGTSASKNITAGINFTNSTVFDNKPTKFVFTKSITTGDDSYSLAELKKIPFNIYSGSTKLSFRQNSDGSYEYSGNGIDPTTGTTYTDLFINNSKQIVVYHLPVGTYSIKENTTDSCTDTFNNACRGTGYYYPSYSNNSTHQFTINECSNADSNSTSCTTHVNATQSLANDRTEIHFTKSDIYSYFNASDKVKFENNEEISAFDRIGFKLKDDRGNYLKLVKVGNHGTCTNSSTDYAEYRYVPGNSSVGVDTLNTCGGNIHITNLCRGRSYTVEEVSVPRYTVYTLPNPHPTVTYTIPQNKPGSISVSTGTKGTISDTPTRFEVWKLDSQTNEKADSEETVFNIYQCPETVTNCTKENGTLVYFSPRGTITGDTEDPGKEVYKYSKLNSSTGATKDLHPYQGSVIMRYLPVDYKYVAVEVNAPGGYYQPSAEQSVEFVIPKTTMSGAAHIVSLTNEPTELLLEKDDIYKYYTKEDQTLLNENTKLLDTAKFSVRDKNGNILRLKKMRDGVFRYLPFGEYSDTTGTTTEINTYNGKLLVTHVRREETYYIEEVKTTTPAHFALPTNVPAPSDKPANWNWQGHPYVKYTLPKYKPTDLMGYSELVRVISNTPTRVVFTKVDVLTNEPVMTEDMSFEVYQCPDTVPLCTKSQGTLIYFTPREEIRSSENIDAGKEAYKYSKLNSSTGAVSTLHPFVSDHSSELILRYLPAGYKYVLVETTAPNGYYQPNDEDRETPFTVNTDNIVNNTNVPNTPTEITFMKSDLYDYYDENDINTENGTVKLFDTAKFVLRDENGNILRLTETNERGIYNYAAICDSTPEDCSIQTYNGVLKVRYLDRGSLTTTKKYYIEEISTTTPEHFILKTDVEEPNPKPANWNWQGHPYVKYEVPAIYVPTAQVIKVMDNTPTRVVISKVNREDYTDLIDDTKTTYKIYQCKSEDECSESDDRKLMRFEQETTISGEVVYKYSKLNNGTVNSLHPYNQGKLILYYLPSNYKYVIIETKAPDGYYEPLNRETYFTVSKHTTNDVSLNNTNIPNDPTKIYFNKDDIYKYYNNTDQARINSDEKLLDTAKFVLRDENGNILHLKKVRDGLYRYIPVNSNNTEEEINTYNGRLTITHLLRTKKYYLEEVKTTNPKNFILPKNVPEPTNKPANWEWQGHPYVEYNVPEYLPDNEADVTNLIENTPTRIKFVKIDEKTSEVILDEKTTFNVYMCNTDECGINDRTLIYFEPRGTITGDNEDDGKEVYKYSKLNASTGGVKDLHPFNGEVILRYLPGDIKYVLVETVAPDGYYNPNGGNEETFFEVSSSVLDTHHNVRNKATKIILNKADIYGYYDNTDVVSSTDNTKIFDTAEFIIKDKDGNVLNLKKVQDGEYRYIPVNDDNNVQRMKTKNGTLIVTHLYRDSKYYIEEVSGTNPKHFVLEPNHPEVEYNIPIFVPDDSLVTKVIQNKPTRIVFNKLDARTNRKVDDEKTTFNIYRCLSTEENCTKNNGELVYFTPRGTIAGDIEDPGKEVYKYSKLNSRTGAVKDLHPYQGELILRYLDANYKYIAVETVAPDGYYNPTDANDTTVGLIADNNTTTSKDVINDYTQIFFNKEDIYKYYNKNDRLSLQDSSPKVLDTAEFVLRDKNGNIVNLKDEYGTCEYRYIPVNSENTIQRIHTCNGSLKITHLYRTEKYYIEEVKTTTDENFILPTTVKKPEGIPSGWNWQGHPYVQYNIPENIPADNADVTEVISNKPTRIAFAKRDKRTNEIVDDDKTTFNVYKCATDECLANGRTLVYFTDRALIEGDQEDPGREVYKYSKLNEINVKDVHPDGGLLVLRYLPAGDYVLVETVAPDGYYNPTSGVNDETLFTVRGTSHDSNNDYIEIDENVENTPTEIIFKKSDFYKYYKINDKATLDEDILLFDTAKFVLRDEEGNILDLKYTETNEEEGNVYRYLQIDNDNQYERINTYKGKLKITNLYRNKTYYIEEVQTTIPGNFILPNYFRYEGLPFDNKGHPVVKYVLKDTEPEDKESVTREIENIPTRVKLEKRDSKYNYLIPDETTTFELYQCDSECHPTDYTSIEERSNHNIRLVYFEPRAILERSDGTTDVAEDKGIEVYKYSKLNSSTGNVVKDLHPDKGQLILRYLPSGYTYVLVETVSPKEYSLPEGRHAETIFTVDQEKVEVEEVNVANKPVSLLIRKYAQDGETLEGATFTISEAKTCNMDIPANKVETNGILLLKTIRDGVYEARETGDTKEFRTCQDRPGALCNDINSSLTYDTNDVSYVGTSADFNTLLNSRLEHVQIQKGEALIQYLTYGKCYVIEEIKAPKGYELPEKEEDRFVMVKVTDKEQIFDTYEELINKPSTFTFYKYDEYNNPLDGGKYKLQKLNKDKKYIDIPVSLTESDDGEYYYKIDNSSNNYIMDTTNGKATVYLLEEGQYRILEVEAPEGYELPKKTINVATFFVDEDGRIFGSSVIANKPKTEKIVILPKSSAELIVNIQTGQTRVRYALVIGFVTALIAVLLILKRKMNK